MFKFDNWKIDEFEYQYVKGEELSNYPHENQIDPKNMDHLEKVMRQLLQLYGELFGDSIMNNKEYTIHVATASLKEINNVPAPIHYGNKSEVWLALAKTQNNCTEYYIPAIVFQLSHEMMHYAFRQARNEEDKNNCLSWFEEIVCTAMSYYAMDYIADRWDECGILLSFMADRYPKILREAREKNMKEEKSNSSFSDCKTLKDLRQYERERMAEHNRGSQNEAKQRVYQIITILAKTNRLIEELPELLYYSDYRRLNYEDKGKDVLIDFDRWIAACPSLLLEVLREIQPVKEFLQIIPWKKQDGGYHYRHWIIEDDEEVDSLMKLTSMLLLRYSELMGEDALFGEACIVFNDKDAEGPRTITIDKPIRIRLHARSLTLWSKVIYQLAHELMHFAFRQKNGSISEPLYWFEEIVCEAMAYYALEYVGLHWNLCLLSEQYNNYGKDVLDYLIDDLQDPATNGFASCDTVEKLIRYNNVGEDGKSGAERDRDAHHAEVVRLYGAVSKYWYHVKVLLPYKNYLNDDGVTFDFDRWQAESPSPLLEVLKDIQPVK